MRAICYLFTTITQKCNLPLLRHPSQRRILKPVSILAANLAILINPAREQVSHKPSLDVFVFLDERLGVLYGFVEGGEDGGDAALFWEWGERDSKFFECAF